VVTSIPNSHFLLFFEMKKFALFVCFLLIERSIQLSPLLGCNCVAFRLDDVQDYWINLPQQFVIDTFYNNNLPLSIGIISHYFGEDPLITSVVNKAIKHPDMEICCHGYNHEYFSSMTYADQVSLLQQCNSLISNETGITPNVFVPPFNSFNQDTLKALLDTGYIQMSSEVSQDPPPYCNTDIKIIRTPIQAQTSYVDDHGEYRGLTHQEALKQIEDQINQFGFAAVMMHPQEFANMQGTTLVNVVNTTMAKELPLLIDAVKKKKGIPNAKLGSTWKEDVPLKRLWF